MGDHRLEVDVLLADIERLYLIDCLVVEHVPKSKRYNRAESLLDYIARHSAVLGTRKTDERGRENAVEVALWSKNPRGQGCGLYVVIRFFYEKKASPHPYWGALFCFYDGSDSSPCLRSPESARAYAASQGYEE